MPRIPLSQRSGMVQHVRSEAPVNSHSMRIVNPENNDAAAWNALNKSINTAVSALAEYQKEAQAVENRLAAAQDRAALRDGAMALQQKLADDPGAPDEEKQAWIERFQLDWEEKRHEYLDRMDPEFRKQHDVEISSMQREIAQKQSLILIEGRAQRLSDEAMNDYKLFCEQGNWAEAQRIVSEMSGSVWTIEQAARLRDVDLPMRQDHFAAKAMADNVPQWALDELNAKDAKGNFVNYKHLTPDDRRALVKYAQSVSNQKEMEEDQAVAAAYEAGEKLYTDDELTERHKGRAITDRQYVRYRNWNKEFDRMQTAEAARQRNIRKALRVQEVNRYYATALYNPDGSPKILTAEDAARICKDGKEKFFGPDADGLTAFYDRVYSQVEKAAAGKTFAQTDAGKMILKYINDKDLSAFYWDTWAWGDEKNDGAFTLSQKLQLLSIAEAEFKRNSGDVEKTIKALDSRLKDLNDGKITSILEGYNNNTERVGKYEQPIENPKRKIVRERFGKDKNGRKYKETIEYVE